MWTIQDAKNKFSSVVDAALEARPQFVSRRGTPAVVIISIQQYEILKNRGKGQGDFVECLLQMPQSQSDGLSSNDRAIATPRDVDF